MQPSALIQYTLKGLARCHMPRLGLWSFRYHLDGRSDPNESRPEYDLFYSLNVLVGLSKVASAATRSLALDLPDLYIDLVSRLDHVAVRRCAYGTALWAAAELGAPVPHKLVQKIDAMTTDIGALKSWRAQDIGMLLSGTTAQARIDPKWSRIARDALKVIVDGLANDSGLFRDCAIGPRRHFGTFATQVYCALGLYQYAEVFNDAAAAHAADRCVARLIELQGPGGEWPWFFDVSTGRVVDFYEVYSVHQHGMAPAILKYAIGRNLPGARSALQKGFYWILGQNQLGSTMLRPDLSLIARSQARRGMLEGRLMRIARSSIGQIGGKPGRLLPDPRQLFVTPEVRSYELAWTLWSFGGDHDFADLTHHIAFSSGETSIAA